MPTFQSKMVALAFAAAIAAIPTINAQTPPSRSPQRPAPGPLPPKPDNPPGVLEGQSSQPPPSGPSPARPIQQAGPQDEERFVTVNNSPSSAWITIRQGGNLVLAGCVPKQAQETWTVSRSGGPVQVGAEITAKEGCERPVICKAAIARGAGMSSLQLQSGGSGCQWQPVPEPRNLKASRVDLRIEDATGGNWWITLYENTWRGWWIYQVGCLSANSRLVFSGIIDWEDYRLRAESKPTSKQPGQCGGYTAADITNSAFTRGADTKLYRLICEGRGPNACRFVQR